MVAAATTQYRDTVHISGHHMVRSILQSYRLFMSLNIQSCLAGRLAYVDQIIHATGRVPHNMHVCTLNKKIKNESDDYF